MVIYTGLQLVKGYPLNFQTFAQPWLKGAYPNFQWLYHSHALSQPHVFHAHIFFFGIHPIFSSQRLVFLNIPNPQTNPKLTNTWRQAGFIDIPWKIWIFIEQAGIPPGGDQLGEFGFIIFASQLFALHCFPALLAGVLRFHFCFHYQFGFLPVAFGVQPKIEQFNL